MSLQRLNGGIIAGVLAGIFLGLFLKIVEHHTGFKVYTLLLNVDYIPLINRLSLPEWIEFVFHLIISILLSVVFVLFFRTKKWKPKQRIKVVIFVSMIIGVLLYPTTALSSRTPELSSYPAWFYWLLGHALYGWILGILIRNE